MPSLHAAAAALVQRFFWRCAGVARWLLLVSCAVAMGFLLVYTGEHYVVVVAGWVAAAFGIGISRAPRVRSHPQ